MTIEQRLDQLEKRNKRLTVALTLMAVTMCAVVTVAATGEKIGDFDRVEANMIIARDIFLVEEGKPMTPDNVLVSISSRKDQPPRGFISVMARGKEKLQQQLILTGGDTGGMVLVQNNLGEPVAQVAVDENGHGKVGAYNREGKGKTLRPGP